jgi:DNA ligase (NAD+)
MIQELTLKIKSANDAYRLGQPIMTDSEYDQLVDELNLLDPSNELFEQIGHQIQDETRKSKLPIPMASMNKVKTLDEIKEWFRLKKIPTSTQLVITPKYDGLSLCVNEFTGDAWTRGDGEYGQKSDEHYKLIGNHLQRDGHIPFTFTFGEVMMSKKTFIEKYSADFANPRNLVAGLLNSPDARESLKDLLFIKYGVDSMTTYFKSDILDKLNSGQEVKVPYNISTIDELTEGSLFELFKSWSEDFEIDGLIIEVNSLDLQGYLGRETSSNNPCWARAFKSPQFEQTAETVINGISWNISKQGYLKPTLHVNPIKLDGVTISNVTGNNARFVKDLGLGVGAKVLIKRSGMVIPIIYEVIEPVEFQLPTIPNIDWNENGVELMTLGETEEQKFKQLVSFFEILEAEGFGEGVIKQICDAGYKTVKDILNLKPSDLEKIDRFGKRKATIVYNAIQKCTKNVSLSKLQHATGIFKGLGSKKLALLEHFTTKPSVDDILSIEGFADISAKSYVDGYDKFFDFISGLPITIQERVEAVKTSNDLDGMVVVYTGIRDKISEEVVVSRGGKIGSSVSKNTTHLICKDPNSGSSKLEKAKSLGIKIMTLEDLNTLLKKSN